MIEECIYGFILDTNIIDDSITEVRRKRVKANVSIGKN